MFIQTEPTPNPSTLKFVPGKIVLNDGTAYYKNEESAENSPFAKRLFKIKGVEGVFFGNDFITITKKNESDWDVLKPLILGSIMEHYKSDEKTLIDDGNEKDSNELKESDSDIVKQIKELLDTRVKPAVAMDGGNIIFSSFDDGIVYLRMQGACSGCPSSTATLKSGIENMLKHYIPEVVEVRPIVE